MTAPNTRPGASTPRSTRAQRRAAERQAARRAPKQKSGGISRNTIIRIVSTAAIVAIIAVVVFRQLNANSSSKALTIASDYNPQPQMLSKGEAAPTFTLKDIYGHKYSLAAQRGHVVFLEFFAVYCPVCQAEAPIMAKLTKNYVPKGVRVWSILSNPYGRNYENSYYTDTRLANAGDIKWFANKFNVHHPQLINPTFNVVNEYGISAYPGLYIVGKNGKISYVNSGSMPYGTLATAVNKALKS